MLKYIAKQVPPEEQDSGLFDRLAYEENIAIIPCDDRCRGHIPDRIKAVMDQLARADLLNWKEAHDAGERYFWADWNSIEDAARDCYPELDNSGCGVLRRHDYTAEEINALMLCEDAYCGNGDPDAIARALSIIYHDTWSAREIHGSSQGDIATLLFSSFAWYPNLVRDIEAEYFNEGSEWKIYAFSEDEIDEYDIIENVYAHAWNDAGIAEEIAQELGCRPDEIEFWSFDGWSRTPKYSCMNAVA